MICHDPLTTEATHNGLQGCNKTKKQMNPLVVQASLALLTQLLALARTPPKNKASVKRQLQAIQDKKDEILTAHGDSEIAHEDVQEAIDDLATVLATATPDDEYAQDPEDVVEGEDTSEKPDSDDDDTDGDDDDDDNDDDDAENEPEPEKPEETVKARRLREKREAEEAEKAEAAKAKTKAKTGGLKKKH